MVFIRNMSAVDPSKTKFGIRFQNRSSMNRMCVNALSLSAHLAISVNGPGTVRILNVQGRVDLMPICSRRYYTKTHRPGISIMMGNVSLFCGSNPGAKFTGWTAADNISQIDPKYLPSAPRTTGGRLYEDSTRSNVYLRYRLHG